MVETTFLGKVVAAIRVGIKSLFTVVRLATSDSILGQLFLFQQFHTFVTGFPGGVKSPPDSVGDTRDMGFISAS